MSFFNDVLDSIGSGKAPTPPPKPIKRPVSTDSNGLSQPVATLRLGDTSTSQNGTKRKAEDTPQQQSEKAVKVNPPPGHSSSVKTGQPVSSKPGTAQLLPSPKTLPPVPPAATKIPPKGSFADIMARAKAAQDQKGQIQVGLIKHQPVSKEKISKAVERKREEEEKAKALKSKLGPKPGSNGRIEKRRSASPTKRQDRARVPKQPTSSYKGTMKTTPKRDMASSSKLRNRSVPDKTGRRHSRYDDYLGTDEEDDSDIIEDEDDGYGSDASSNMEAGAFDIDEEENRALQAAKDDDAREQELEKRLKRQKEERRRKLQSMADKKR
jgi:SPT2 chromatin protein